MDQLYSTGRYGVVDIFHRRIWVNNWSESMAHDIRRVFRTHVSTIVVDLKCFDNFSDELVDSDVSLNWQIPHMRHDDRALVIRVKNPVHDTTINYLSGQLCNTRAVTLLQDQQAKDLQRMMLFYLYIKSLFLDPDHTLIQSDDSIKQKKITFLDTIDSIFRTEINLEKIKAKIQDSIEAQMDDCFDYSSRILRAMGRLYG